MRNDNLNNNDQPQRQSFAGWRAYLFLVLATLLANGVAFQGEPDFDDDLAIAGLLALCFSQTGLVALAAVARRNRYRAWAFVAVPLVSYLASVFFGASKSNDQDLSDTSLIAAVFFLSALIVMLLLGPYRFWRSLRVRQREKRANEPNDWRFGIRHYLVASIVVAAAGSLARIAGDEILSAPWIDIVVFLVSLPSVAIICGLLLQEQPLHWQRLALAVALSLAIGWSGDQFSDEHESLGGVRMNAIQLAVIVPWLWLPRWWNDRNVRTAD